MDDNEYSSDSELHGYSRTPRTSATSSLKKKSSPISKHGPKRILATSKGKPLHSILNKRAYFKVIVDGVDLTPKSLFDTEYLALEEKQQNALDFIGAASMLNLGSFSSSMYMPKENVSIGGGGTSIGQSFTTSQMDVQIDSDTLSVEQLVTATPKDDLAPSQFLLPKFPYTTPPPPPTKFLVTLKETPTFFLLDRPSLTEEEDTKEGKLVAKDNELYEYITVGKGRNRKIASTEAQTIELIRKARSTMAERCTRKNSSTFTCTWDIYKTYKMLRGRKRGGNRTYTMLSDDAKKSTIRPMSKLSRNSKGSTDSGVIERKRYTIGAVLPSEIVVMNPEEEFQSLVKTMAFQNAVAKMERILASNVYNKQQKVFKGLLHPDPFRLDVEINYTLQLLWTFSCDIVRGRNVTSMSWNTVNENLLAVGYGKHYYSDYRTGLVCCWCVKNPTQPERTFKFESPVTSLEFSKDHPNLLAVGFYNGTVAILNISAKETSIVAQNSLETSPFYAPVWQVTWFLGEDYHQFEEQIMTCGQDGRICRYRKTKEFTCFPMMRISRMEGKVKGIAQPRKCKAHEIPISCHPAALVLTRHPSDCITYFVGTDEGCVHKCSTNYLHQHLDLFLAHVGPVYTLQFSPFCKKIFLTCGADWCVRIWAEGIGNPLITLTASMDAVLDAAWSPINSSIIASISATYIYLWDIRRKTFVSASTLNSPTNSRNSTVQFTKSGQNLVVGDIEGNVHVFALRDMPFNPFFQENSLAFSIKKALVANPAMLKQLKKLGRIF